MSNETDLDCLARNVHVCLLSGTTGQVADAIIAAGFKLEAK